jgi:hypothetical protein
VRIEDQSALEFAVRPALPKLPFNPLLHPADKSFVIIGYSEYGKRVGETHHNARIPDVLVERMRDLRECNHRTYREIARMLGVGIRSVAMICTYKRRAARVEKWKRVQVVND